MPVDGDAGFVGEIRSLRRKEPIAENFLRQVVLRLQSRMSRWDWVGIYFLVDDTLVLGPFVGEPTEHVEIPIGIGVCGTAVEQDTNITVEDVRSLQNYLACSLTTRSELVVLIRDAGEVVAQFDVESDQVGAFRRQDELLLERLVPVVSSACRAARDRLALQRSCNGQGVEQAHG